MVKQQCREGLVRERLDRFLLSMSWLTTVPFLASFVVHQANSDHDLVVLDTLGRKLNVERKDPDAVET